MEKPPKYESGPEEIDSEIEKFLEKEQELFARYVELHGEPGKELEEKEYWIVQEANVGKDRTEAKERLEQFVDFLEKEIAKKKD